MEMTGQRCGAESLIVYVFAGEAQEMEGRI